LLFSIRVVPLAEVTETAPCPPATAACDTTTDRDAGSTREVDVPAQRRKGLGPLLGMVIVRGRSMTPTLSDGDRLLVRYGASPKPGRVAVVRFADGVVAVKRLDHRSRDGWWVVRDNAFEGRDSWSGGAIAEDGVLALVVVRLWPRPGRLPDAPPVGE
jgi:SOS-response transcriptional repressor LexA